MKKDNDKNKYVAAILQRHYIDNNKYLYTFHHLETGSYDEQLHCFIDRNGNEYAHMSDDSLFYSEIPYSYDSIIEKKQLHEFFGQDMPLSQCISLYEDILKDTICFSCKTKDGRIGRVTINLNQFESIINGQIPPEIQNMQNITNTNSSQDIDSETSLDNLILNIIDGTYTIDELKKLRESAQTNYGNLENLLDTLNLQIEASEKGESFVKLKNEKKQKELEETFENVKDDKKKEGISEDKKDDEICIFTDRIDLIKILNAIKKTLIAQDDPARMVITEIARKEQEPKLKERGILLTGQTGVGKTKLMSLIAKNLDRPFYKIDATKLTVPGYVGTDIEEELWKLYVNCGKDLNKAEHAIIFIDEIDKKGSDKNSDISGKGVLNTLLPFFEGTEYDACESVKTSTQKVKINTSNMTIILGGAFQSMYDNLKGKKEIGFKLESPNEQEKNVEEKKAETEDFEKAGIPKEFVGRIDVIKLNDMDVNSIKRVIKESDESALHMQEKIFKQLGVKLTSSEEFLNKIASEAVRRKTGARGLNTVIEAATREAYFDVYTKPDEYSEVILTEETAEDPKKYILKPKNNVEKM